MADGTATFTCSRGSGNTYPGRELTASKIANFAPGSGVARHRRTSTIRFRDQALAGGAAPGPVRVVNVLLDTNVVLDVLLKRDPWLADSQAVWQASDDGLITGYLMAAALTDILYIARRLTGRDKARQAIVLCMTAFRICPVDRAVLEQALLLPGDDFEDAANCGGNARGPGRDRHAKPDRLFGHTHAGDVTIHAHRAPTTGL